MREHIDYQLLLLAKETTGYTKKGLIKLAIDGQIDICAALPENFKALRVSADGLTAGTKKSHVTERRPVSGDR